MMTPHGRPGHGDHRIRSANQPLRQRIIELCDLQMPGHARNRNGAVPHGMRRR